jgi:Ca2+-transporting ATPase
MVLKDDSFSSIVLAIKQGRIIFENIRKFVIYLLSCNLSELLVIATASIFNLHFQLFPLQILFINLVTDVLPALALAMAEGSPDIMKQQPRNIHEPIITKQHWKHIFFYSAMLSIVSVSASFLGHYVIHENNSWNSHVGNNILFFTLIFAQLLHIFNMGAPDRFFSPEISKNKYIWGAISISAAVVILCYVFSPIRHALNLFPLELSDCMLIISSGLIFLLITSFSRKFGLFSL